MPKIKVGTKLYGFCNGYFGRDSFEDKECIAKGKYKGIKYATFFISGSSFSERIVTVSGTNLKDLAKWSENFTED